MLYINSNNDKIVGLLMYIIQWNKKMDCHNINMSKQTGQASQLVRWHLSLVQTKKT